MPWNWRNCTSFEISQCCQEWAQKEHNWDLSSEAVLSYHWNRRNRLEC